MLLWQAQCIGVYCRCGSHAAYCSSCYLPRLLLTEKVRKDAEIIGTAEDKARNILDEALKAAETKKREALLEVKEESLRTKNELERETKERRNRTAEI